MADSLPTVAEQPTETPERRAAPRWEWKAPLQVQLTGTAGSTAGPLSAWSGNISSSGICFRSRTRLTLGRTILLKAGPVGAMCLRIVRERPLPYGLWEYGATICASEEARVFELPQNEYEDLLQAFDVIPTDGKRVDGAGCSASRDLLLTLREVTQDASECIERAAEARRTRGHLRSLLWVALVGALAMFSIDHCAECLRAVCERIAELLLAPV